MATGLAGDHTLKVDDRFVQQGRPISWGGLLFLYQAVFQTHIKVHLKETAELEAYQHEKAFIAN